MSSSKVLAAPLHLTFLAVLFTCTFWSTANAQSSIPLPLLFSGNTTAVAPPLANTPYGGGANFGQFALLARETDCSMSGILAEVNQFQPQFTVQLIQADYQDNLHQLAGLTTIPDQFPNGCPLPPAGNPAYPGYSYAGRTASGTYVIAIGSMTGSGGVNIYNGVLTMMTQQVSLVQTLTTPQANIQAIAAADLNGDGVEDLVVSTTQDSNSPGQLLVFLGNANGTFQTSPVFTYNTPAGTQLSVFSIADVNNDGKLDLAAVVGPQFSGSLSLQVLFGQGNGQFTTGPSTPLTAPPRGSTYYPVLVADLNGDHFPDVVVTDGEVLMGDGAGHFTAGTPMNLNGQVATWLTAADFNGDHKLDVAAALGSAVGIYPGRGDGTFGSANFYAASSFTITATDVDGDGNLDLVLGPNGGGAFLPDEVAMFTQGFLQVLMGNGDGTFQGAPAYHETSGPFFPVGIAVADLNGDNHPDILTSDELLLGDGTGRFTAQSGQQFPGLSSSAYVSEIRIADLNGDHIPDAVVVSSAASTNPPFVALGHGGGTFNTGTFVSSVPHAIDVNLADLNGDHVQDLIVVSNPSGNGIGIQLNVLLGHGDGGFGAPQQVTLPSGIAQSEGGRVYAADLNNDGKQDLVVIDFGNYTSNGNCVPGGVYVLLGNGDGSFGPAHILTPIANPYDAAIADFNDDGKLDLILSDTNYTSNCGAHNWNLVVGLGNGDGTFRDGGMITTTPHLQASTLTAVDFDHDGKLDVLMGGEIPLVAFGNGDGSFQAVQALWIANGTQVLAAELNGDNHPDVVTRSHTGSYISILLNRYAAQLIPTTTVLTSAPNPSNVGQVVTMTATVTAQNGSTPSGTVIFQSNGTNIGSAMLNGSGVATLNYAGLPAGSDALVATYQGSGTLASSTSNTVHQTVNKLVSTTTVTSTPNPSIFGQQVTITATIGPSGPPAPTGTVSFTSNGTAIAGCSSVQLTSNRAQCVTSSLAVGTDALVATYSGDSDYNGSSGRLTQFVNPVPVALQFVAVTPCRVVDTRPPNGNGPIMGGTAQSFVLTGGACGIPTAAIAYSLNVTAIPNGRLGYLSIWPTGQGQPVVSTLNSPDGRIKANAAIVPAGDQGAVSVFVTNTSNVILDINGYFRTPNAQSLQFFTLPPCRIVDTRNNQDGGTLQAGQERDYTVPNNCQIPDTATAYSFNVTVIPPRGGLDYLTVWPQGSTRPVVSTLNDSTGTVVANAALVPAGVGGGVAFYAHNNNTDLLVDTNGYFAQPAAGGLSLYPVAPCRVFDSRQVGNGQPFQGTLNPPVNVVGSQCAPPGSAEAYVFNATVVPANGPMGYLTLWPDGQMQPTVSTLNARDGLITSNLAIVPTTNGMIDAYAAGLTQLILDISGYFAP